MKFDGELGAGVLVSSVGACCEHPFSGCTAEQLKLSIRGVNLAAFVLAKGEDNRVSVVFDVIWRSLVHVAAVNGDGAPLELSYGIVFEVVKMSMMIPPRCCQELANVTRHQGQWISLPLLGAGFPAGPSSCDSAEKGGGTSFNLKPLGAKSV